MPITTVRSTRTPISVSNEQTFHMRNLLALFLFAAVLTAPFVWAKAQPATVRTDHREFFYYARQMQEHIGPQNTDYRHKDNIVGWGENGSPWQCYADCSGFINALLSRAFGLDDAGFQRLFGHRRMYAYHYFDAIKAGNHFQPIRNIRDVRPGDLIALEYADRSEHDDNTGHVMVVDAGPRPHRPSRVIAPNTRQFEVAVIDCSRSAHGTTDTRYGGYAGVGKGIFRLYTDSHGEINGYSWSDGNPKEGFNPFENPIVVGRIAL